jgi:hypothetical protein
MAAIMELVIQSNKLNLTLLPRHSEDYPLKHRIYTSMYYLSELLWKVHHN